MNKIVSVKEDSEPYKSPQPIAFVFVFFELPMLMINPLIRQETNIASIK